VGVDRREAAPRPDVRGDAQALPFCAGAFDTVLCSQVLEHLPEPGRAVGEMARALREGGYLIVTAPHIWGVHEEPHDYYRFTRYGLAHLMEQAGLEVVEVRAMAGYWVTAGARFCYYLEAFERGILKPFVRLGYGLVQECALLLDRLHRVEGDTWNYLAVGRKPG
jgi:SAM-dependent methyltransferase